MSFNNRIENVKEGAYFEYFKFFTVNTSDAIKKLQQKFQEQVEQLNLFDSRLIFRNVKTLLSSYQLLIMEIYDSCQFVQIPQFGACLLKIFYQMMGIVKYMAKSLIAHSNNDQRQQQFKRCENRRSVIGPNSQKFHQIESEQQRQSLKMREQSVNIFKHLTQQVGTLEHQHSLMKKQSQKTQQSINKGKRKLQQIQISQSQNVLAETVKMLYKRGQHISNFVTAMQNSISTQNKQTGNIQNFARIKQMIDQDSKPKINYAMQKLSQLFKQHVNNHEQNKQSSMISVQCQTHQQVDPQEQKKKSMHSRKNNVLTQQLKKTKIQTKNLEEQNKSLKNLLHSKVAQYENMLAQSRADIITLKSRLNTQQKKSSNKILPKKSIRVLEESDNMIQNEGSVQSHLLLDFEANHKPNNLEKSQSVNIEDYQYSPPKTKHFISYPKTSKSKVAFQINHHNLQIHGRQVDILIHQGYNNQDNITNRQEILPIVDQKQQIQQEQNARQVLLACVSNQSQAQQIFNNQQSPIHREDNWLLKVAQVDISSNKMHSKIKNNLFRKAHRKNDKNLPQLVQKKQSASTTPKAIHKVIQNTAQNISFSKQMTSVQRSNTAEPILTKTYSSKDSSQRNIIDRHNKKQTKIIQSIVSSKSQSKLLACNQQKALGTPQSLLLKPISNRLTFLQSDLLILFKTIQNASNYQYLNLTKNRPLLSANNKNLKIRQITSARQQNLLASCIGSNSKEQHVNQQQTQAIVGLIMRQLRTLQQSRKQTSQHNYHQIKNFIRYPYSSVFSKDEQTWKKYSTQNVPIDYMELKKCIGRIDKFHASCVPQKIDCTQGGMRNINGQFCGHWLQFLGRINILISY